MILPNLIQILSRTARYPNRYLRILNEHIKTSSDIGKLDFCRGHSSLTPKTKPLIHSSRFVETQNNLVVKRYKKSKKSSSFKGSADEVDEEEEDDDDELSNENPLLVDDILGGSDSAQTQDVDINSLRLDSVTKVVFKMTRAKVEEQFYNGCIFINGERPSKKSCDISEGDEIDVIRHINPEDHTMVDIRRVQILKMPDKATETGRMKLKVSRAMDMTIKNPDQDRQQD